MLMGNFFTDYLYKTKAQGVQGLYCFYEKNVSISKRKKQLKLGFDVLWSHPSCACPTRPTSPSTPSQAPRSALSPNPTV